MACSMPNITSATQSRSKTFTACAVAMICYPTDETSRENSISHFTSEPVDLCTVLPHGLSGRGTGLRLLVEGEKNEGGQVMSSCCVTGQGAREP